MIHGSVLSCLNNQKKILLKNFCFGQVFSGARLEKKKNYKKIWLLGNKDMKTFAQYCAFKGSSCMEESVCV